MEDKNLIKKRIDWFCYNKINAFSPTISPAPKSIERNEIESLYEGILWFLEKGVSEIVIQKKYMGSYCDIYLHKNLEESYLVSRNGYKINHLDKEKWLIALQELHGRFSWENVEIRIIQSELMPWSAMGKGLISDEFSAYYISHQIHSDYLQSSNLYEKLNKIKKSSEYLTYIQDVNSNAGQKPKEKYPTHIIRQYEAVRNFNFLELNSYSKNIHLFKNQLDTFGKEGNIFFKPFNILKEIYSDGSEYFVNDNLSFRQINDDDFLHYSFENQEDFTRKFPEIQHWVNRINQSNEEGVMIKPRIAFLKGIPPAFKVRNNDYLTLVYGVDFQDRMQEQINKRNIKSKLKCSINDWAINQKMLEIPYKQIHEENYYFKSLLLDRILEEYTENQLDSRL